MGSINLSNYFILVLSAGIGQRMKSLGNKKPKSILKKNNKTLLSYIIEKLKKYKSNQINFILGYKYKIIIKELEKLKVNYSFIHNKHYRSTGSIYSWYTAKNKWKISKKKILLIHSDLFFDTKFLFSILNSKHKNIIGIKKFKYSEFERKKIYVSSDKKNKIVSIGYGENLKKKKITGQILCINKLSSKMSNDFFQYCEQIFSNNKKFKKFTWEIIMDKFIKERKKKFYILKKQDHYWFNINSQNDYKKLIKFKVNE